MTARRLAVAGAALLLGAAALAWWPSPAIPFAGERSTESAREPAELAAAVLERPDVSEHRVAAAAGTPSPPGIELHVRLRGLHRDAPWTVALHVDIDGRDEAMQAWLDHDASATPDADGRASFALPAWAVAAHKGRITAQDPHYAPLAHRWEGSVDPTQELVLDVQVVASLQGRVIDARGAGVRAARIAAFAVENGSPTDRKVGETNTDDAGGYRVRVAPGVPVLLVAVPMRALEGRHAAADADGGVRDDGTMRADLLPASCRATAVVGATTTVGDLVLRDAAAVTGVVRWSDGAAVARATVATQPHEGLTLTLDTAALRMLANGDLAPVASAAADDRGAFRLPGIAGAPLQVRVTAVPGVALVAEPPAQAAVPPQNVELTLPRPVRLRATHGQDVVPRARFEIENERPRTADDAGGLSLLALRPLRVRAAHERLRSAWVDLAPEHAGTTIALDLAPALGELSIEFQGDFRVRNSTVTWRSEDGREGRQHLLRDDGSGPFRVFLEPGRYHVRAGPGGGERNGHYLLPVERDVDLTEGPVRLVLPATFGGTFHVYATDSSGLHVGGTCRVLDNTGADVTEPFVARNGETRRGAAGELLTHGPNEFTGILPPGNYELQFDFAGYGAQRYPLVIRPREITDVRVRL